MATRNRGKPKLRDLSRHPLTRDEINALRKRLIPGEAPIVTAVLGQAVVEAQLESILRTRFKRSDDSTWGMLVSENGPLGSFFAKIVAAYAFGLINDAARKNLNIVRDIRNAFAHSKSAIDFRNELVVAELLSVVIPPQPHSQDAKDLRRVKAWAKLDGQNAYIGLCLTLYSSMVQRETRGLTAKTRNRCRTLNPLLAALLKNQPAQKAGSPLSSLADQTGDPTVQAQMPGLLSSLLESLKSDDKKDK